MNERERYLAPLWFQRPDRVPFNPGHGRESTRAAWRTQRLPPDFITINEDMTYKQRAMIGPDMCREYLFSIWRQWGGRCAKTRACFWRLTRTGWLKN